MNPDRIDPRLLGLEAYVKPSVGLRLLHYVLRYRFVGKTLTGIELDPDKRLVDLNRDNNRWGNNKPVS